MKVYVVTESNIEANLIKHLIPADIKSTVHVSAAGGRSTAISYAQSILMSRNNPVAIVLDADTLDKNRILEQKWVFFDLLRTRLQQTPCKVFLAIPEIEIIFFQNTNLLSKIVNVEIRQDEIQEAQYKPKYILDKILSRSNIQNKHELIEHIDISYAKELKKHLLIRSLMKFLNKPSSWKPTDID